MRLGAEKFEMTPGESVIMSLRRELLGTTRKVEEIEKEREVVADIAAKTKSNLFSAALIREKERKSGNPIDPQNPFANFVRLRIAEALDLPNDEALKFYSAVSGSDNKTVLERDFRVDAFFELELEKGTVSIPIGLTVRPGENPYTLIYNLPRDFPIHGRFGGKEGKGPITGLSESEFKLFDDTTKDLANNIARRFKHLIEVEKTKKEQK